MYISFIDLLNTSISASWLVLVIILLRLLLKKVPKAFHCALWALVAIRLLCPFSIESEFSLIPSAETVSDYYLTQEGAMDSDPAVLDVVDNPIYPEEVDITLDTKSSHISWLDVEWSAFIWPSGMGVMALYALISYLRLRKRVSASIPIARDIRICDYIDSPFILGILRPKIYLPSNMEQEAVDHVLAHERAHLARKDHWWKPLGFALLTIHWFNPVMWLGYILLCRDIELACDEKVIKDLDTEQKKSYSSALLQCSVSRPMIAACPLAFGEVCVKGRVKNVLHYKKPTFWVVVLAIILCGVVAVCFLTNPLTPNAYDVMYQNGYTVLDQRDQNFDIRIPIEALPADIFSEAGHTFGEKEVIVYQTDTSTVWLMHAQYANEGDDTMYFEFNISHDLPNSGSILLPSRVKVGTRTTTHCFQPAARTLYDGETSFEDAVSLRAHGPEHRFTVYIATAAAQAAREELRFGAFMNLLTYVKDGHDAPDVLPADVLTDGSYVSQEKVFWSWHSSLYVEGMTMEVENDTVTLDLQGISLEGPESTFPLEHHWQTECPINETRRQSLAELSKIEPIFAIQDLSDCRYLVIDSTHFFVETGGELYLVKWNHSNIHLEIIEYIFRMVPEDEWEPLCHNVQPSDESDTDRLIRTAIFDHNQIMSGSAHYAFAGFFPLTQAMGDGPYGSSTEFCGPADGL